MSELIFLTLDDVFRIQVRSLAEHGGGEGVREPGLVESAVAAARNIFYYEHGNVYDIAAGYAFHLAESQAFVDGNKRTAVGAALVFLALNGAYVRPATWELYLVMIDIAKKTKNRADLAGLFRKYAQE